MKANKKSLGLMKDKSAYTKIVGGLVALLLMIIIGVLVFWEVNDSITLSSNTANASRNETTSMATTVFALLPIIALVVVASIIIGVIIGFGGVRPGI